MLSSEIKPTRRKLPCGSAGSEGDFEFHGKIPASSGPVCRDVWRLRRGGENFRRLGGRPACGWYGEPSPVFLPAPCAQGLRVSRCGGDRARYGHPRRRPEGHRENRPNAHQKPGARLHLCEYQRGFGRGAHRALHKKSLHGADQCHRSSRAGRGFWSGNPRDDERQNRFLFLRILPQRGAKKRLPPRVGGRLHEPRQRSENRGRGHQSQGCASHAERAGGYAGDRRKAPSRQRHRGRRARAGRALRAGCQSHRELRTVGLRACRAVDHHARAALSARGNHRCVSRIQGPGLRRRRGAFCDLFFDFFRWSLHRRSDWLGNAGDLCDRNPLYSHRADFFSGHCVFSPRWGGHGRDGAVFYDGRFLPCPTDPNFF